jgi:uncharacterized membrane protein YdcZ (DUF606 family)
LRRHIEQPEGAGISKYRLKTKEQGLAVWLSAFGRLLNFISGNLTRRTLLFVLIPLIFVSYFGILASAIFLSPIAYDWRYSVISHLISPRNNPEFPTVPSLGIAITGLLIIPFTGYINRRLRVVSRLGANIGTVAFASGAIWLTLAGLIVSQGHDRSSNVPRLHEMCARTAAFCLGAGMVVFCLCALKGYLAPATGKKLYQRRLLIPWIQLTLGPSLGLAFSEGLLRLMQAHPVWPYPIEQWKNSLFWHLAFWEWIGSASVFLFLLSSALFLPKQT